MHTVGLPCISSYECRIRDFVKGGLREGVDWGSERRIPEAFNFFRFLEKEKKRLPGAPSRPLIGMRARE